MFKSTLFSAEGGTIDASGGPSAGSPGGNGRYVVSENSSTTPDFGTRTGASEHFFSGQAARDINPFIDVFGTTTHNIAGLQGGADVYGIMSGVTASDSFFSNVRSGAPPNAVAALARSNVGPTGDNYLGQDHLLLVNLTNEPLSNPMLGLGTPGNAFAIPLLKRGFANNPAFGGAGPLTLSELPAGNVYATLIGEDEELDVTLGINGLDFTAIPYNTLDVFYVEATTVLLDGDFDFDRDVDAADYVVWRKTDGSSSGYNLWRTNFGRTVGAGSVLSTPVPEPTTVLLLGLSTGIGCCSARFNSMRSKTLPT